MLPLASSKKRIRVLLGNCALELKEINRTTISDNKNFDLWGDNIFNFKNLFLNALQILNHYILYKQQSYQSIVL